MSADLVEFSGRGRRVGSIRARMLAALFFVHAGFFFSADTWAKQEAREPFWTWRLYGGNGHDFHTPQAVIDARNALQEQQFAQCAASDCGSCVKTIYNAPTRVNALTVKINGQLTTLMTDGGTHTSYKAACSVTGAPAFGPTSTPSGGDIAATSVRWCPSGYGMSNGPSHKETIDGYEVTTYTSVCVKDVPDPPTCCKAGIGNTQFGNPIDAMGTAKVESQTDYRSADGLLSVERSYSSQLARWSWNHDFALVDFTGRGSTPPSSTTLVANIKAWPPVMTTGPAPPLMDIPVPFPLTSRLTEQGQPHVWVLGSDGRRIVFNEGSVNTFSTTAPQKPQLGLISGPGSSQQWLLHTSDRFQIIDLNGQLVAQVFADGKSIEYSRQGSGLVVTASPGGRQLAYSRSTSSLPAGVYDVVVLPGGSEVHYGFDPSALVTSVTYPDSRTRIYLYDEPGYAGTTSGAKAGRLTGVQDETNVRYGTYAYDSVRPVSTELAGGVNRYEVTSSSTTFMTIATPTQNGAFTVRWGTGPDGERRLTSRTQPAGAGSTSSTSSLGYDASGNIASWVDYKGVRTCYANDQTRGLELVRVDGLTTNCPTDLSAYAIPANTRQRKISTQWHPAWSFPVRRAEPKKITTWVYNGQPDPFAGGTASCAPTSALLPDGSPIAVVCKKAEQPTSDDTGASGFGATTSGTPRTWSYTYNEFGQVLTADGPRTDVSDVTAYTYYNCSTGNQCGQIATVTNALGHTTTYSSYNAHGQPLTMVDPNGVVTTLTYDPRQRLTSRTVDGEQTTFDYWPTGLLKKATLPDGSYLEYTYDAAHRLTGINDGEGNRIAYILDAAGNRTGEEAYDPFNVLASTRTRAFDALSRVSQEIGAAGTAAVTTGLAYDNNGNQTSINAPLSRSTVHAYDELNRLKQVTDPATGLTRYAYDGLDHVISVTDPRNKVTSYTFNGLGDLTQQVSPDTGTTTSTYDSAGNLATSTDARSKSASYAYDALNRVTSITYPDQTISYTYDTGTNQKGRLTQLTDNSGSTSWSYDAQGRVLSRQQAMGAVVKSIGYAYDTSGRLQSLTLPSGNVITYGYANGKVASLTLNGATTLLSNVLYHPFGPTAGWTWGNNTLAVREYDQDGKLTLADSAGLKTYAYDDAFRITAINDASDPALSQNYGYDLLDRLTSASGSSLNQSWTYDANGNRLTEGGSQASTYTVSGTSNRVNAITGTLTKSYGYDNAGNTTSDGSATYTYNDAGRMISATKGGVTSTYALNGLGQRVRKTTSGVSTYFVYDEAGHLIGEYDGSGDLIAETIWFGDIPIAVLKPNGSGGVTAFYIHADHLNTPRRITRPSDNAIVWRWDADPFGATLANENPSGLGAFSYNLRFPGQLYDSETGLHYNYFRDYDPSTGRYVQSDPIGLEGGINTYAYVAGNPVDDFDLFGLSGKTEKIPGGNPTTVRIDKPHVPGQQTHAHVCEKGCKEIVVNKDGTGSHGTDPKKLKNKVKDFLRKKGFKLMVCPPFLEDIALLMAAEECRAGDPISCSIFQDLGGTIEGPIG